MLLTVSANVFALTCCSQCCTKGIVRVVLDGLEHLHLGCARGFIRIENDIISIRHIVRVDSHTFEVVTVIHHDTNLCVMAVTKAQVIYTAPNLDNTVFVQTAFVTIANRNAVGTHAGRTLELLECLTAIIRMVVTQRLNVTLMLIRIFLVVLRFCNNHHIGLLVNIGRLPNANAVALITIFSLKSIDCFVKFVRRNTQDLIDAFGNVNHAFLVNLFFQGFHKCFGIGFFFTGVTFINRAHR